MRALKTIGIAALLGIAGLAAAPQEAVAGDRHGRGYYGYGRGWGPPPPRYYRPPPRAYYYAPPPRVYYAPPPPVYYAPPPRYYYGPPAYYGPPGVSLNFRF